MKIFDAVLLIGICMLIMLGAVFSEAMFRSVSIEGGSTAEAQTISSYQNVYAWIYIIALFLIITVIIIAYKLLQGDGV